MEDNYSICPNCGERALSKIKVAYTVFKGRKHPDGACNHCGNFTWKRPATFIPEIKFRTPENKDKRDRPRGWWLQYERPNRVFVKKG